MMMPIFFEEEDGAEPPGELVVVERIDDTGNGATGVDKNADGADDADGFRDDVEEVAVDGADDADGFRDDVEEMATDGAIDVDGLRDDVEAVAADGANDVDGFRVVVEATVGVGIGTYGAHWLSNDMFLMPTFPCTL